MNKECTEYNVDLSVVVI